MCLFILLFIQQSQQKTKLISNRKKLRYINDVILPRMLEQTRRNEFLFYDESRYNSNEKMEKHIMNEEEALLSKELDPILEKAGNEKSKKKAKKHKERKLSRRQLRRGVNVDLDNDSQLLRTQKKLIDAEMENIQHIRNRKSKKRAMKTLQRDLSIFSSENNALKKYDPFFALGGVTALGAGVALANNKKKNNVIHTAQASARLQRVLMEDSLINQQLGILKPIIENLQFSKTNMDKTEKHMMFKLQGTRPMCGLHPTLSFFKLPSNRKSFG